MSITTSNNWTSSRYKSYKWGWVGCLPVATHGQTTHRPIINEPLSHGIHELLACGHTSSNRPVATNGQATHRPARDHLPPLGHLPMVTHHTCQWPSIAFQLLAHGYPSSMGHGHPRPLASVPGLTHCCLLLATNHH